MMQVEMFGIQHIRPAAHLSTPASSPMVFFLSFTNKCNSVLLTFTKPCETESLQFKKLNFLLPSRYDLIVILQKILSQTLEGDNSTLKLIKGPIKIRYYTSIMQG